MVHGNRYRHGHKHCYTEKGRSPASHADVLEWASPRILVAPRFVSCSDACADVSLLCHEDFWGVVNDCEAMNRAFACEGGGCDVVRGPAGAAA